MRVPRFLLSSAAIACCLSLPALAEPTNAELDQRVRALEEAVETLTQLLQAQQAGAKADGGSTETGDTASATPLGYQMGAVFLDVYVLPMSSQDDDLFRDDPGHLPNSPVGVPSGSAMIKASDGFRFGDFRKDPTLAPYANATGLTQVRWSGSILIQEDGPHTFLMQLKRDKGNRLNQGTCRTTLRVADKTIIDIKAKYRTYDDQVDAGQSTEELVAGMYDFSIWQNCWSPGSYDQNSLVLSVAAPGDRSPKPIPPERFGVQP